MTCSLKCFFPLQVFIGFFIKLDFLNAPLRLVHGVWNLCSHRLATLKEQLGAIILLIDGHVCREQYGRRLEAFKHTFHHVLARSRDGRTLLRCTIKSLLATVLVTCLLPCAHFLTNNVCRVHLVIQSGRRCAFLSRLDRISLSLLQFALIVDLRCLTDVCAC